MEHLLNASPTAGHQKHNGRPGDGSQFIILGTHSLSIDSVIESLHSHKSTKYVLRTRLGTRFREENAWPQLL